MKYTATIDVQGNPEKLYDCLASETMDYDRSSFKITKKTDGLHVDIEAKDSVALRATLTALTQLFTVYEKVEKI